jgi:hypothetical protein
MNSEEDDAKQEPPEDGEQQPPEYEKTSSVAEVIVMILVGISVIFGVLVLLVLGTCFLG